MEKRRSLQNWFLRRTIKNLSIPFLAGNLVKHYYEIVKPIDDKRKIIFNKNQQPNKLSDWLLPMLMNGQVKVGELKNYTNLESELNLTNEKGGNYGN